MTVAEAQAAAAQKAQAVHQLTLDSRGSDATLAQNQGDVVKPVPKNTLFFVSKNPKDYKYENWYFLHGETLRSAFGSALAKRLVDEGLILCDEIEEDATEEEATEAKPRTPSNPAQEKAKSPLPKPLEKKTQGPATKRTDESKWAFNTVAGAGALTDSFGNLKVTDNRPPRRQGQPLYSAPKKNFAPEKSAPKDPMFQSRNPSHYTVDMTTRSAGPSAPHPRYAYSERAPRYSYGTYKTAQGEPSHGKINIKMLSNLCEAQWFQSGCLDPLFCFDYLLHGRCAMMQDCFLRHVMPQGDELPSLRWFNPALWRTVETVNRRRRSEDTCTATRLFPNQETAIRNLPGFPRPPKASVSAPAAPVEPKKRAFGGDFDGI
ncbi:uncharacterized protein J4E92_010530 [Alternaria infectoria]|uniref:uncharacterized protein n=1 Tax=Alternaria infectoria TaxID=45303 RepID=UPI00222115BB|nr:uncharacterized protein J4E92_010530 [Alternaria infectoria]KAI4909914.1 hypothetical protein J4E92_010530 [Alternaria infectoria]